VKSDKGSESDDASDEETENDHPVLQAVRRVIIDLDDELGVCLKASGQEPETKLEEAAAVKVSIPDCGSATRSALQAVLSAVPTTVQKIRDQGKTLVVPKSQAQLDAEEEFESVSSKSALYTKKMNEHYNKGTKTKNPISKEYERSRYRHYKEMDAASTPFDSDFIAANARPAEERTKQMNAAIWSLLGDFTAKMKSACEMVGGKEALQLPEGVTGASS
jgi:hypothetical protein